MVDVLLSESHSLSSIISSSNQLPITIILYHLAQCKHYFQLEMKSKVHTLTDLGLGFEAFAAACVRAKLSTITATNKLYSKF